MALPVEDHPLFSAGDAPLIEVFAKGTPMVSVVRGIEIRADAAECWNAVKDFGALHERLAPLEAPSAS